MLYVETLRPGDVRKKLGGTLVVLYMLLCLAELVVERLLDSYAYSSGLTDIERWT